MKINNAYPKVKFHYHVGGTSYYLLTNNSGYASAGFCYPYRVGKGRSMLVVPEMRAGSGAYPPESKDNLPDRGDTGYR